LGTRHRTTEEQIKIKQNKTQKAEIMSKTDFAKTPVLNQGVREW